MGAQSGARHVYAVEANAEAAKAARECVREAGLADCIDIIEGISTSVQLPEPVDVVIAEGFGSVASEEGAVATFRDARRFLREPDRADSWIPLGVQTLCAPVYYRDHGLLTEEDVEIPVRLCAMDPGVTQLAAPQLVESFRFDLVSTLNDEWCHEVQFSVQGPVHLSGFTLFIHVAFAMTPHIWFEDSTSWQQL